MSFLFSPYLSQILMELLKFFISLQRIKISIYVCNVREVIFKLFSMVNFTIKDRFFLHCGPIRTSPKRSSYGPLISGSVYTGCGCQLPRFEAKNRTGLNFKTLVNDIKLLPHHCCCSKSGLIFILLLWQQHFLFITHSHKDHKQGSISFI
jgi:hypothetical protein